MVLTRLLAAVSLVGALACAWPAQAQSGPPLNEPKAAVPAKSARALPPELAAYPRNADGTITINKLGDLELRLNPNPPKSPMTVLQSCIGKVQQCAELKPATAARSVDRCFSDVPRCKTEQPWKENEDCCPNACVQKYEKARRDGVADWDAFFLALAPEIGPGKQVCVPEFDAWIKGKWE